MRLRLLSLEGARTYLILSRSQIVHRDTALELARRVTIGQLNESALAELSGIPSELVGVIQCLRSEGVNFELVISGENRLAAYYREQ